MNKWLTRIILLAGYCIPFVFLSMFGDIAYDTMLLYGLMIIGFSILCFSAIKLKQFVVVIIGNIISFVLSYIYIQQFYTEDWSWYFKPFSANMLMTVISIIAFFIQIMCVLSAFKKQEIK